MMLVRRRVSSAVGKDVPLVNLNARVPKNLWRRVRLECLHSEVLLRSFVTQALEEHLAKQRH